MMKRILALLLALVMMIGCAQAETVRSQSIATYVLPDGAEALHVWDAGIWDIPEGLEQMYAMMQEADGYDNVYLARMKNGMALVSVSCSVPGVERTMADLHAMWEQIAMSIAQEAVAVDASAECATLEELFGFEALHIRTVLRLESGLQLSAEGAAFYRGDELMEVWAVAPVEGTYAQDEERERNLLSDRADMKEYLDSLNFSAEEAMAVDAMPFVDPDGRFALAVPAGATVISRYSTQEEIAAARAAYVAAHAQGADKFFDEYISDVNLQNVVVFISGDQQVVAEVFASREEDFEGVTPDQLRQLAQPIAQSLAERFDVALLLSAEDRAVLSGTEHAWITYWVRSGEADVQMDVIAAVLDDAWLYEVDIYTHDGDQELRSLWFTYMTQSIVYTPLVNALD